MYRYLTCLGLICCLASRCWSDPVEQDPFVPEIARLINKLGDPDPSARHAAGKRLREIGRLAIPQLRDAAKSSDPEVQREIRNALRALDRPPLPDGSGDPHEEKAVSYDDRSSTIDIIDGKRTIRVYQKNGKWGHNTDIKLTITGPVDGKQTTQVIEAADADQMRWDAPEIWKIYNAHFNIERRMSVVHVLLPDLETWVNGQIESAHLSRGNAAALREALKAYSNARDEETRAVLYLPDQMGPRSAVACEKSDALRKLIADLKLPNPPENIGIYPASTERLDVVCPWDSDAARPRDITWGVVITSVAPSGRAADLGIRPGDIVQKVNGVTVNNVYEMRQAVSLKPTATEVDVIRDFKPVHLPANDDAKAK